MSAIINEGNSLKCFLKMMAQPSYTVFIKFLPTGIIIVSYNEAFIDNYMTLVLPAPLMEQYEAKHRIIEGNTTINQNVKNN